MAVTHDLVVATLARLGDPGDVQVLVAIDRLGLAVASLFQGGARLTLNFMNLRSWQVCV